ncbi:D-alanyl-D-alanine carboxypeptidase (penicillin-binding protein 5/6) [Desulfohalotomaculum tongense]|uniref:D-alanyl-D-alanine carboxypeptidase family protein n=1 Tax=Desulforadius tongensis TaxID=1216062 RepID=UPI001EE5CD76|nr:D-alanyl-D-alanine carboxypeptidase family protein [Desulforadius tongensis]MBM7855044.1 D-alanyl-D-alanine carboxypeptidase (penicillin-binding protein 5/6) [Desulforadius tongensis]
MFKNMYLYIFSIFFLLNVINPGGASAGEPKITARAAILMDAETGQVFYAQNAEKRRSPASLTKIMTAILAIELGSPNDVVVVSKRAQNIYIGSQIYLKAGEKIKLRELIKAALIYSANDSTVAIAEHVGGSEKNFVRLMNQKALALGAVNTNFVNTNGYSVPNHYSTAYDLAKITRYALQNSTFAQLVRTKEATIHWESGNREKKVRSTNRLLRSDYPGVDGVKTGTTARAGNCLIASATRGNRQLIAVVLHSRNRYKDAARLLEYGFNEFKEQTVIEKGQILGELEVKEGVKRYVQLVAEETMRANLPIDGNNVGLKVNISASTTAPVKKGQQLGYAVVTLNGQEVGLVPLVAKEKVRKRGMLFKIWQDILNSR